MSGWMPSLNLWADSQLQPLSLTGQSPASAYLPSGRVLRSSSPDESFYVRRILAIILPALLLLTACSGSGEPEPTSQSAGEVAKLDSIKVTDKGDKATPGLEFAQPLEVAEPTIKVVSEGSGDAVKAGQIADIAYLAVNGADGTTLEDTFPGEPEPIELNEELKTSGDLVYNALLGAKIGSYLALAAPGTPASGSNPATPTQLLIIKVLAARDTVPALEKPEGEVVTPPAGLPTVTENNGVPEISVEGVAAPTELIAQDLIKGSGAVVEESNTLTVNYLGVNLSDGTTFDSSFERGEPAEFPLTGVIPGWTQGLAGKTVGSRVLLVIPQDLAYGEAGSGKAKGDLVFVVDILGAK